MISIYKPIRVKGICKIHSKHIVIMKTGTMNEFCIRIRIALLNRWILTINL